MIKMNEDIENIILRLKKTLENYEKIGQLSDDSVYSMFPTENKLLLDYITQLQNNWNELKNGLKSLFEFDEGVVSKDYLECAEDTLEKMQELEQVKDENN